MLCCGMGLFPSGLTPPRDGFLAELERADPQPNDIFANLCHRSDTADLPMELRAVAGSTERTLLHRFATINGSVRGSADVKGVVHVIVELVGVSGILLTR